MPTIANFSWLRLRLITFRHVPWWQATLIAVGCSSAATALRLGIGHLFQGGVPFITFLPAVVIASAAGGVAAGFLTLAIATVVAASLWLRPGEMIQHSPWAIVAAFWLFGGLIIAVFAAMRASFHTQRQSHERAELVARELRHRIKNILAIVGAIVRQTARNSASLDEFQGKFTGRIGALARAQDNLNDAQPDAGPRGIELQAFLAEILQPFGPERFSSRGPPAIISAETAFSLALLLHELATNATKYGALSVTTGQVRITWLAVGETVQLDWKEVDGPRVVTPATTGFGTMLARTAFPSSDGLSTITYDPDGVRCSVTVPASQQGQFGNVQGPSAQVTDASG